MATHLIEPTRATLHGSFNRDLPPVLTIDPGDTVVYRTLDASWGRAGKRLLDLDALEIACDPERDVGHANCGPVAVRGAQPGDTLAVTIEQVIPGEWGWTWAGPGYQTGDGLGLTEEVQIAWTLDKRRGVARTLSAFGVAGNLPGDEPGVRYHFITCLGWDAAVGVGLFADGDNAAAKGGSLNTFDAAQLEAAKICGVLEITTPVKGWSEVGVPAGWRDDGTTLTAPNGVVVVKGFRDWVLTHTWRAEDEPQGPEAYANPVEYSDPASGAGSIQAFSMTGQLCWTPVKGVYVAVPGAEIFALRAALDAATKNAPTPAEIAALEAIREMAAALNAAGSAA
jgi:hypothetical protein